ncbi:MAG: Rrf2 family transcriptional regulator [Sandaracinaceae bacterium]|nr:Rrf2 family transcriptional regulator [Sandaracinaceae bacterium]
MRNDSRLSSVLHALLHMASHTGPMTSEQLATCMQTNPVVVRRTMAGLREAGIVRSEKGRGGGWSLERVLAHITLRDLHDALGEPSLFAVGHHHAESTCLVEQAVNAALGDVFEEAERLLLARLGAVTLAQLEQDFTERMGRAGHTPGEHHHARHAPGGKHGPTGRSLR